MAWRLGKLGRSSAAPLRGRARRDLGACVRVLLNMNRLGIYVQVPFCQTKCTYCNFHTGVVASSRFGPYVEAVCREIRGHGELLRAAGVEWPGHSGRPARRIASLKGDQPIANGAGERSASESGP